MDGIKSDIEGTKAAIGSLDNHSQYGQDMFFRVALTLSFLLPEADAACSITVDSLASEAMKPRLVPHKCRFETWLVLHG